MLFFPLRLYLNAPNLMTRHAKFNFFRTLAKMVAEYIRSVSVRKDTNATWAPLHETRILSPRIRNWATLNQSHDHDCNIFNDHICNVDVLCEQVYLWIERFQYVRAIAFMEVQQCNDLSLLFVQENSAEHKRLLKIHLLYVACRQSLLTLSVLAVTKNMFQRNPATAPSVDPYCRCVCVWGTYVCPAACDSILSLYIAALDTFK